MTGDRQDTHSPSSVADVLNAAADLLDKPGAWTQGYLAKDDIGDDVDDLDPSAVCWCAVGALSRSTVRLDLADTGAFMGARTALSRVIGIDPLAGLPHWNDAPERTQAEVVQALRDAAKASSKGPADE